MLSEHKDLPTFVRLLNELDIKRILFDLEFVTAKKVTFNTTDVASQCVYMQGRRECLYDLLNFFDDKLESITKKEIGSDIYGDVENE